MNTIYRLVFNRALRVWQVASELVKGGGGLVGHVRGRQSAALAQSDAALALDYIALAQAMLLSEAAQAEKRAAALAEREAKREALIAKKQAEAEAAAAAIKGRKANCPVAALHPVPATSRAALISSR